MKKALQFKPSSVSCWYYVEGRRVEGPPSDLRGDASGLRGDVSGLQGDASGLRGDASGLRGDVSGLWGDVSACELTAKDQEVGIDIRTLVQDR